ncbi:MAG: hypothetical protein HQL22_00830 [Candidatus Omnitrophica bacterium]|nr:hypothetical protein [Candidatus Omnitrophota bacterium]
MLHHFTQTSWFRGVAYTVIVAFLGMIPAQSGFAQVVATMPMPGTMVHLSSPFQPANVSGMKVDFKDPFHFYFIMDNGQQVMNDDMKKKEYEKIIKYFMASLTTPNKDMWVNLSPIESDRIIPENFSKTALGRDLLAQDYFLKQMTASLIYPEDAVGKKFWEKVYAQAYEKFGTTDIPIDTFNKVWITPDKADIFQKDDTVLVVDSHLKVMLEQDFMMVEQNKEQFGNISADQAVDQTSAEGRKIASDIVREIVVPMIEKEVNQGEHFATTRQAYNAMILATWFKKSLKASLLGQAYADKDKSNGININDPKGAKEEIYNQYLEAFKKGVFNYVKEEKDAMSDNILPRKYFSGGLPLGQVENKINNVTPAQASAAMKISTKLMVIVGFSLLAINTAKAGVFSWFSSSKTNAPTTTLNVNTNTSSVAAPTNATVATTGTNAVSFKLTKATKDFTVTNSVEAWEAIKKGNVPVLSGLEAGVGAVGVPLVYTYEGAGKLISGTGKTLELAGTNAWDTVYTKGAKVAFGVQSNETYVATSTLAGFTSSSATNFWQSAKNGDVPLLSGAKTVGGAALTTVVAPGEYTYVKGGKLLSGTGHYIGLAGESVWDDVLVPGATYTYDGLSWEVKSQKNSFVGFAYGLKDVTVDTLNVATLGALKGLTGIQDTKQQRDQARVLANDLQKKYDEMKASRGRVWEYEAQAREELRKANERVDQLDKELKDKIEEYKRNMSEVKDSLQKANDDLSAEKDKNKEALDQIKGLQDKVSQGEQQLNDLTAQLNAAKDDATKANARADESNKKVDELGKKVQGLEKDLLDGQAREAQLKADLEKAKKDNHWLIGILAILGVGAIGLAYKLLKQQQTKNGQTAQDLESAKKDEKDAKGQADKDNKVKGAADQQVADVQASVAGAAAGAVQAVVDAVKPSAAPEKGTNAQENPIKQVVKKVVQEKVNRINALLDMGFPVMTTAGANELKKEFKDSIEKLITYEEGKIALLKGAEAEAQKDVVKQLKDILTGKKATPAENFVAGIDLLMEATGEQSDARKELDAQIRFVIQRALMMAADIAGLGATVTPEERNLEVQAPDVKALNDVKEKIALAQQAVEQKNAAVSALGAQIQAVEGQEKSLADAIESKEKELAALVKQESESGKVSDALAGLLKEEEAAVKTMAEAEANYKTIKGEVEAIEAKIRAHSDNLKDVNTPISDEFKQLVVDLMKAEVRLEAAKTAMAPLVEAAAKAAEKVKAAQAEEKSKLESAIKALQENQEKLRKEIADLRQQQEKIQVQLKDLRDQFVVAQADLRTLVEALNALKADQKDQVATQVNKEHVIAAEALVVGLMGIKVSDETIKKVIGQEIPDAGLLAALKNDALKNWSTGVDDFLKIPTLALRAAALAEAIAVEAAKPENEQDKEWLDVAKRIMAVAFTAPVAQQPAVIQIVKTEAVNALLGSPDVMDENLSIALAIVKELTPEQIADKTKDIKDIEKLKASVYNQKMVEGIDGLAADGLLDLLTRLKAWQTNTDVGKLLDQQIEAVKKANVGGINLGDENLTINIKVDGNGMPLPLNMQDPAMINLDGLTPIIREIMPVTPANVPVLSELAQMANSNV